MHMSRLRVKAKIYIIAKYPYDRSITRSKKLLYYVMLCLSQHAGRSYSANLALAHYLEHLLVNNEPAVSLISRLAGPEKAAVLIMSVVLHRVLHSLPGIEKRKAVIRIPFLVPF